MVSTKVGGIPEVLPSHMIHLCKPEVDGLFARHLLHHRFAFRALESDSKV